MDFKKLKEKYKGVGDEFDTLPSPIIKNLNFIMMCEILEKLEQIAPTQVEEKKVDTKKTTTKK